ncbi:EamA family transporter, partial [Lachnotalea glycerini]
MDIFIFISYFLQSIGCVYTTAGKNAFITTIYVVIVPFLYWIISKTRPDIYCVAAAFMAIIGIGLLSLNGDKSINIGDILTLISGFGYAIHMVFISKFSQEQDTVVLTFLQILVAAILSWITAPIMDGGFPIAITQPDMLVGMFYLG